MGIFKEEEFMRKESTAKSHVQHGFTQFELTNYLLNNLSQFNITPAAKLVLLELSAHYNPQKPDMFTNQKTLASKIGISERSVVRAVSELFKAGLIIIECKYTNRYKFTSKIGWKCPQDEKFFPQETLSDIKRQNGIKKDDNLSQHEQIKETKKEQTNVIVVYSKIPAIITTNKKIRNPQAYWASLSQEIKEQYMEKQRKADKSKEKIKKVQELELKQKEEQKRYDEISALPLEQQWTRETALNYVKKAAKCPRLLKKALSAELIELFRIQPQEYYNTLE